MAESALRIPCLLGLFEIGRSYQGIACLGNNKCPRKRSKGIVHRGPDIAESPPEPSPDFAVVLRDSDLARVEIPAKPLQQMLRECRSESAGQLRRKRLERLVGRNTIVVESDRETTTRGKSLVVAEIAQ